MSDEALAIMGTLHPAGRGIIRWLDSKPKRRNTIERYPEVIRCLAMNVRAVIKTLDTMLHDGGWIREFSDDETTVQLRVSRSTIYLFVTLRLTRAPWVDELPSNERFEFDVNASEAVLAAITHYFTAKGERE